MAQEYGRSSLAGKESEGLVIGIDVGTGGVRALVIDGAGNVVAEAKAAYPLLMPRPGWTEQNPDDWWQAAVTALRELSAALGERVRNVAAIGLTGQMHGSVFLDKQGEVIRPALLWNDQRTVTECKQIEEAIGRERLVQITGNEALTGFTSPKILWLRNHEPEAYGRLAKVLLPKDYIRFRLTGEYASDMADASGTLLLDVKKRAWSDEVLAALDLNPALMPAVYEGPDVTGHVTEEAARATGMPSGIPVVAGGGDQAAGAVGLGVVREGIVSCSLGTSGVVFAPFDQPPEQRPAGIHLLCHAVPGRWHMMGVVLSAGGALQWFRDAVIEQKDYDVLNRMAESVPPGADGLLFLPYLTGERSPHMDPYARAAFVGLGLHHGKAHMTRAVMEGVAYALMDSYVLLKDTGLAPDTIRVTGGGARSHLWCEILASLFGTGVVRMAVDEGPAFGAAVLASVGAGMYETVEGACDAMVRTADTIAPPTEGAAVYAEMHKLYQRAYRGLRDVFATLGEVVENAAAAIAKQGENAAS